MNSLTLFIASQSICNSDSAVHRSMRSRFWKHLFSLFSLIFKRIMNIIHCAATHRTTSMAAKRLIYPAADRNKDPILGVLKNYIRCGSNQLLLEIASGTGQHVAHFAPHFPQVHFYPSEYESSLLESIIAHTASLSNVNEPEQIDISTDCHNWSSGSFRNKNFDYIYSANMIHVSPYKCSIGLFKNAGILLKENGILFTYGPYAVDGKITPESNIKFNESIKTQNPEWGLRDIKELEKLAKDNQLQLVEVIEMPANNKTIVWKKY